MEEHLFALLDGALSCPVKWGYFSDGETMPRVTMIRMSGKREHTLTTKGLMRGAVQIDCWGLTYAQALDASRDVRAVLERYSGGPIVSAHLTATRDGFSSDATAAQRVSLTFALTYHD
ncbi:hypothetical protein KUV39_08715 [Phaeobacter italicus]|uniref:hypothetical protein n=1 Tax=Phaeobacter italicus TaxID=481446 RepID=UPI001C975298|nr:hypothetical protein [Phaeobacter italicus]MBY5976727.1 hypothetical protein [Phaeobacter italicus]